MYSGGELTCRWLSPGIHVIVTLLTGCSGNSLEASFPHKLGPRPNSVEAFEEVPVSDASRGRAGPYSCCPQLLVMGSQHSCRGFPTCEMRLLSALRLIFSISLPLLHSRLPLPLFCAQGPPCLTVLAHPNLVQSSQLDQSSGYFLFLEIWLLTSSITSTGQMSQLSPRNVSGV